MLEILSNTSHIPLSQTIADMFVGHACVMVNVSFFQKLSELFTKALIRSHRMTVTFPQQDSLCEFSDRSLVLLIPRHTKFNFFREPVHHDQTKSLPILLVLS